MIIEREFYSIPEVAEMMGRSREHTYRLAREHVIPSTRLSNGRIVVPADAFREWRDALTADALAGAARPTGAAV